MHVGEINTMTSKMESYSQEKYIAMFFCDSFSRYDVLSDEVKIVIRQMISIIIGNDADQDEKDAALTTLTEALYPYKN